MGGGTSRAGFGVLPVTVPARLRNRTSSSRLLLAESPTFAPSSDFPVVSMFILTVRGRISALKSWRSYQPAPSPCHLQVHGGPVLTHLLRSMGSAELQRAHGSPARGCSGRGFIYGRGIQLLRWPWRPTQSIYPLDNGGPWTTQAQQAQVPGRLGNWFL